MIHRRNLDGFFDDKDWNKVLELWNEKPEDAHRKLWDKQRPQSFQDPSQQAYAHIILWILDLIHYADSSDTEKEKEKVLTHPIQTSLQDSYCFEALNQMWQQKNDGLNLVHLYFPMAQRFPIIESFFQAWTDHGWAWDQTNPFGQNALHVIWPRVFTRNVLLSFEDSKAWLAGYMAGRWFLRQAQDQPKRVLNALLMYDQNKNNLLILHLITSVDLKMIITR